MLTPFTSYDKNNQAADILAAESGDEEDTELIQVIAACMKFITTMNQNVLDVTTIETGQMLYDEKDTDVNEMFGNNF